MRRSLICLFTALVILSNSPAANAAEPIAAPAPTAPATRSVAARDVGSVVTLDARTLAMHQYFYIDFPRQQQTLDNETQLAEAELALIARRVASYRPFRSFGRYAATYTVDQSWQVALLAAQKRLQCLRNDQADLWRQRGMVAVAFQSESLGQ